MITMGCLISLSTHSASWCSSFGGKGKNHFGESIVHTYVHSESASSFDFCVVSCTFSLEFLRISSSSSLSPLLFQLHELTKNKTQLSSQSKSATAAHCFNSNSDSEGIASTFISSSGPFTLSGEVKKIMTYWVYHERQQALLCGQHALNNLVQANAFSADSLAEIAGQLDQMELNYMANNNEGGVSSKDYLKRVAEGSGNVDDSGNFSIEVLRSALLSKYNLELPNIRQQGLSKVEVTTMDGFICNRESHWFAIRKINDRYWNLNSTLERPEVISHFRLAAEVEALQNSGYSVFCIVDSLPPPCTNEVMMDQGLVSFMFSLCLSASLCLFIS